MFAQWKGHVFKHGQVGKQGAKLEQHAHTPTRSVKLGLVHGGDVLPVEQHLSGLRPVLPADQPQDGGLATAGGAHQRGHLAAGHRQGNTVEHHPLAVTKGEVLQFDEGF